MIDNYQTNHLLQILQNLYSNPSNESKSINDAEFRKSGGKNELTDILIGRLQ